MDHKFKKKNIISQADAVKISVKEESDKIELYT